MTEYTRRQTIDAPAEQLFAYLSEVRNLPRYFPGMTSAEPRPDGDEVHVTADVNGRDVAGTAAFHVDEAANRIEWSSEGPNDYHGWLQVSGQDDQSTVEVHISSERVSENGGIDAGLERTLAEIARLVVQDDVEGS